ncbi:serine/threonine-protein kinase [Hoyosella altamirensis]|uniref:non-specific serine/threonine protein kinase n=1 Tax=Hoyosella altamirensis TaxID=616997 RepID=A0A839RQA6_9ACTN|nr:serine/threonine-protein kinase [Hoyosella altamirensis]MBB3038051.1 serine/threonine-protein kinase [Hoyosella altamirensis]
MTLNSGTVIKDRYRLQRFIASGGMGEVWEALDTVLDRRVAIKILKSELSADSEFLSRFRIEARTTAQLHHPSIASIFDYGETSDDAGRSTAFLVMELINGEPLNAVISRMGRIPVPLALDMLEQTGNALQVAHEAGLVHRDVKPGNILVTPAGQVKITDFGIAKAIDAAPVTRTGLVMGTAQYISPEQASGQNATAASDVYSLGVVGYEAIAGKRPFVGEGVLTVAMKHIHEAPAPLPEDVPAEVRTLIEVALSKDPATRYANGGAFASAVAKVRAGKQPPDLRGAAAGAGVAAAAGAAATRVMPPTGANTRSASRAAPAAYGYQPATAAHGYSSPPPAGLSTGQKAVAWGAAALLVLALITTGILMMSRITDTRDPIAPPVQTTELPVQPEPEPIVPTTPEETTPETTEPEPTTPEETTETDEPPVTDTDEPETVTETPDGLLPRIIPGRGNSAGRGPSELPEDVSTPSTDPEAATGDAEEAPEESGP